jgi:3-dehydroquinate synthase
MSDLRRTIRVSLPQGAYEVSVGPGLLAEVGAACRQAAPHTRALVVVDEKIAPAHVRACQVSLRAAGYLPATAALTATEERKTLPSVQILYEAMFEAGLERGSPVVAMGGGIVVDVAGFAAATWLRGVPFVAVPTTLLAMVDASVGGKTGVNLELPDRGLGKNLVGAFWQPVAVIADPDVLETLDPRDYCCGLAECVKCALVADASLLSFLSEHAAALLRRQPELLVALIERCVRIKAAIVEADERESGRRMWLNLGHTFAHAIEAHQHLHLRHGEAVSIGLVAAAHYARSTGRIDADQQGAIEAVIERLGLPSALPTPVAIGRLVNAMRHDKKITAGRLRLVLPRGIGSVEVVGDVDLDALSAAWARVGGAVEVVERR